ncbi:MAG: TylF/MycF family methyltransferase, partial [Ignavibacteria bacterium]|nr:TylF/MycF family methyltransferase [Ignavibacteria bacterium]
DQSISTEQLLEVLKNKNCEHDIELIAGDITETIPEYVKKNPDLKISFLNLDTDIYEPSVTILENLYPKIETGGVLILDDYGVFPGETKAADDYFKDMNIKIKKFPFSATPCYFIKE